MDFHHGAEEEGIAGHRLEAGGADGPDEGGRAGGALAPILLQNHLHFPVGFLDEAGLEVSREVGQAVRIGEAGQAENPVPGLVLLLVGSHAAGDGHAALAVVAAGEVDDGALDRGKPRRGHFVEAIEEHHRQPSLQHGAELGLRSEMAAQVEQFDQVLNHVLGCAGGGRGDELAEDDAQWQHAKMSQRGRDVRLREGRGVPGEAGERRGEAESDVLEEGGLPGAGPASEDDAGLLRIEQRFQRGEALVAGQFGLGSRRGGFRRFRAEFDINPGQPQGLLAGGGLAGQPATGGELRTTQGDLPQVGLEAAEALIHPRLRRGQQWGPVSGVGLLHCAGEIEPVGAGGQVGVGAGAAEAEFRAADLLAVDGRHRVAAAEGLGPACGLPGQWRGLLVNQSGEGIEQLLDRVWLGRAPVLEPVGQAVQPVFAFQSSLHLPGATRACRRDRAAGVQRVRLPVTASLDAQEANRQGAERVGFLRARRFEDLGLGVRITAASLGAHQPGRMFGVEHEAQRAGREVVWRDSQRPGGGSLLGAGFGLRHGRH